MLQAATRVVSSDEPLAQGRYRSAAAEARVDKEDLVRANELRELNRQIRALRRSEEGQARA